MLKLALSEYKRNAVILQETTISVKVKMREWTM